MLRHVKAPQKLRNEAATLKKNYKAMHQYMDEGLHTTLCERMDWGRNDIQFREQQKLKHNNIYSIC